MLEHASKWLKSLRDKFPSRYYTVGAIVIEHTDISAKLSFKYGHRQLSIDLPVLVQFPILCCSSNLARLSSPTPFLLSRLAQLPWQLFHCACLVQPCNEANSIIVALGYSLGYKWQACICDKICQGSESTT